MMLNKEKDSIAILIGEEMMQVTRLRGSGANQKVAGIIRESLEGVEASAWPEKIAAAIKSFGLKKKKTSAYCVIPSNIITTKNIEIPSLDDEEIHSIIDLQAGRHTPYSREEILIDYVSIGVFQRNYTKVLLVIANRELIKSRLEACELAGLRLEKILFGPECIATFYAKMLDVKEEDDPLGIVNIGYLTTDFIVEHNQTVATCRSIPIGVKAMLAEGQAGKDRLVAEILQSLEIYNNEDINKPPAKYILTVDTDISRELQPLLKAKLNVDVLIIPFEQKIPLTVNSDIVQQDMREDSFSSLVAATAFAQEGLQIDLMPDEVRNQRSIEEQGRQVILAGIFAMIILVLVCGMFFFKIYFRDVYLNKIKEKYVVNQYLVVRLDRIAHRTRIIKDFLATRMTGLDVMRELYRLIPEEMYLQNIFMDEQGVVNIQGISESMSTVFDVVKALEDSELFKGVKTRSTTAKKDRGKDAAAFDIIFKLESAPDGPIGEATQEDGGEAPPAE